VPKEIQVQVQVPADQVQVRATGALQQRVPVPDTNGFRAEKVQARQLRVPNTNVF